MNQSVITLSKSRHSLLRSIVITGFIILIMLFFVMSDVRATGDMTRFGWLGVAATLAGLIAIAQQVFHFRKEPSSLLLDFSQGRVVSGDNNEVIASFDRVTFFALSTNKSSALIECSHNDKMVMRIKRHYDLPMKISDILAKYSEIETVELNFIGLTQ